MNYKQLIVISIYLTLSNNLLINGQTTINGKHRAALRERRLSLNSMNTQQFPSKSAKPHELVFGVLFPAHGTESLTEDGVAGIMPAIDAAVQRLQKPGGLFENFNVTLEYRDTQCSSAYGPLAAFELYSKRKPG